MDYPEYEQAKSTLRELIPLVDAVESDFSSARNWGFFDLLGGGFIVDMIKHHKLNKASQKMYEVNNLLQRLSNQLGNLNIPVNYTMEMNGLLTFADFVVDGFLVDAYVTSKIMESLDQIRNLKAKLLELQKRLGM